MSNNIENIPLRVGQIWASYNEKFQTLTEIIGFSDDYNNIICQTWDFTNEQLSVGSVATRISNSQDPANTITHTYESLFPIGQTFYLVVLYNSMYEGLMLRKIVISTHEHSPMRTQRFLPSETMLDILYELGMNVSAIYTDGGWKKSPSPTDPLNEVVKTGGAIVLQYENGNYACIQLNIDLPTNSVYPVELLALTAARIIAKGSKLEPVIYSDSQASLDTMSSISKCKIQKQYLQYVVAQEKLYAAFNAFHVKSHVETREKNTALWTRHEKGNFIADKLALYDWTRQQVAYVQIGPNSITIPKVAAIQFSSLIQVLSQRNSFAITSLGLPSYHCLKAKAQDKMKDEYIYKRDQYRAAREKRVKWAKRDLRTLKYTFPVSKSLNDKVLRTKIIFNKHWTGENQNKYASAATREDNILNPLGTCQLCGIGEETQQHIIHLCLHKDMVACRAESCCNINTQISALKKLHPEYGDPLDTLRDIAYTTNNTFLWTGLWPERMVSLTTVALHRTNPTINLITLLKLARVFTLETKSLYQTRASILNNKIHTKRSNTLLTPSPSILNCFPRQKKPKVVACPATKTVNVTAKKATQKPQVVRKITQFFVKKDKPRILIHKIKPNQIDKLPIHTFEEIITEFRNRDPPFVFLEQMTPPDILTRTCRPFTFSPPGTGPAKRKRSNLEPGITPVQVPIIKRTRFPLNTPSEETLQVSPTRKGIG